MFPLNTLNKTKLTRNGLEKKLYFCRESRRVGRRLIIVNESIHVKETENLIFFGVMLEFYFTNEYQNLYIHSWLPLLVKILHLVFIR